jgi:hypothetical protein
MLVYLLLSGIFLRLWGTCRGVFGVGMERGYLRGRKIERISVFGWYQEDKSWRLTLFRPWHRPWVVEGLSTLLRPMASTTTMSKVWGRYSFISGVSSELTCTVGDDTNTVCAISTHESSPSFFLPHFCEGAPYACVIGCSGTLNLE